MSDKLPSISLNVICKNEEKVIGRMLRSVAPLIDYYVIVDTGSTDNTKKIIKETMDELNIPGEIHDHEWVNFCTARNYALEKVKGKAEWGFWIDCDEQLIQEGTIDKTKLSQQLNNVDLVSTQVEYGPQTYFRSQLFRTSIDWEWRGAVHEVMFPPKDVQPRGLQLKGIHTLVSSDGASWGDGSKETQKAKYLEHAEMLEEYIKTDKDPRWLFYLAQSYRDAFEYEKSEHWYTERLKHPNGYWEELYWSALMVAHMRANQKKSIGDVMDAYMMCSQYDPGRCEHFIPVIKRYQSVKNWVSSYAISKYCFDNFKKSPFPKSTLFIDNHTYNWQILDLHSVNCYYTGNYQEAKTAYNKLLKACSKGLVPESDVKRIKANMEWYTKKHIDEITRQTKQRKPAKV